MKTPKYNNPTILYEDPHIIVCIKPHGLPTQSRRINMPDMEGILKSRISQTNSSANPYLSVIHRLDQPVKGILVFAKTPFAAKELNLSLTRRSFGKYYRALIEGTLPQEEGALEDYLIKDSRANISRTCKKEAPGAKYACLHYKKVKPGKELFPIISGCSEIEVCLETGRHHQIRVQLSSIGCPIVGDTKYHPDSSQYNRQTQLCLCAYKLIFPHPKTHKNMCFELKKEEG